MNRKPWLAALALALLAPAALASAPRGSAPLTLEAEAAPSLRLERALASDESSRFALALFTGDELRPETHQELELSYPKTRVWGLRLSGAELHRDSSELSAEGRWGCAEPWLRTAEGTGTWLSEDPAGDVDSPNRYAYVGWRPNEFVDPTGDVAIVIPILAGILSGITVATDVVNEEYGWAAFDAVGGALSLGEIGVARSAGSAAFGFVRGLRQAEYAYNLANVPIAFDRAHEAFEAGDYRSGLIQTGLFALGVHGVARSPFRLGMHWDRAPSGPGAARLVEARGSPLVGPEPGAYGTPYRQLRPRAYKLLQEKVAARTITREEWNRLRWHERLQARRKAGIDNFWIGEQERLTQGLPGSRDWSPAVREGIIAGERPSGIFSHHKYSVSLYPQLANNPLNIYPVTYYEHFYRWHGGGWGRPTHGVPRNPMFREWF